jgi:hypothetical protein
VESQNSVRVTWSANRESGITGYNVYRCKGSPMMDRQDWNGTIVSNFSSYTKLNSALVTGTEYADSPNLGDGVALGYIVRAVNEFGLESGYSPVATTFPSQSLWFRAALSGSNTKLTWQPPEGIKVAGYNAYGYDLRNGGSRSPINTALITDTVYTASGSNGFYTLRAVNVLGQEGYLTDEISPTRQDYTTGDAPAGARFDINKYAGDLPPLRDEALAPDQAAVVLGLTAHPNPLTSLGRIGYFAPRAGVVELAVYDVRGRIVKVLSRGRVERGYHWAVWEGGAAKPSRVMNGVYFVRLKIDGWTKTAKMILAR